MVASEIMMAGEKIHEHDIDATPKVLRVMNPNRDEEGGSISSKVVSEKSKTFSFRSFSGSFSSLWRRHNSTSTAHSRRSCIPISIPSRQSPPSSSSSSSPRYYKRHSIRQQDNMERNEVGGVQRPNPLQPPPLRLPAVASPKVTTS